MTSSLFEKYLRDQDETISSLSDEWQEGYEWISDEEDEGDNKSF